MLPNVPEGRGDRSLARSAWDSATPKDPSRRGYGLIRAGVGTDSMIGVTKFRIREIPLGLAAPDHTVPYGTILSRSAFLRAGPAYDVASPSMPGRRRPRVSPKKPPCPPSPSVSSVRPLSPS